MGNNTKLIQPAPVSPTHQAEEELHPDEYRCHGSEHRMQVFSKLAHFYTLPDGAQVQPDSAGSLASTGVGNDPDHSCCLITQTNSKQTCRVRKTQPCREVSKVNQGAPVPSPRGPLAVVTEYVDEKQVP